MINRKSGFPLAVRLMMESVGLAVVATAVMATSVDADIIATCGPKYGHSYFFPHETFDGRTEDGEWTDGPLKSKTIFVGDDNEVTDIIISGTDLSGSSWTRSASDYGAPVSELLQNGKGQRLIIVMWADAAEVYLLDTRAKIMSLTSQKFGLVTGTHAWMGTCE